MKKFNTILSYLGFVGALNAIAIPTAILTKQTVTDSNINFEEEDDEEPSLIHAPLMLKKKEKPKTKLGIEADRKNYINCITKALVSVEICRSKHYFEG